MSAALIPVLFMLGGCATTLTAKAGQNDIVALAEQYEGLHEKWNRSTLKKVTGVDPVRTPWCAAFINTLLEKEGIEGSGSNSAASFQSWGKRTHNPRPGDIVVMHNHVAIFIRFSDDGDEVIVIGGNQDNSVKVGSYPKRRVIGYRTAD